MKTQNLINRLEKKGIAKIHSNLQTAIFEKFSEGIYTVYYLPSTNTPKIVVDLEQIQKILNYFNKYK